MKNMRNNFGVLFTSSIVLPFLLVAIGIFPIIKFSDISYPMSDFRANWDYLGHWISKNSENDPTEQKAELIRDMWGMVIVSNNPKNFRFDDVVRKQLKNKYTIYKVENGVIVSLQKNSDINDLFFSLEEIKNSIAYIFPLYTDPSGDILQILTGELSIIFQKDDGSQQEERKEKIKEILNGCQISWQSLQFYTVKLPSSTSIIKRAEELKKEKMIEFIDIKRIPIHRKSLGYLKRESNKETMSHSFQGKNEIRN